MFNWFKKKTSEKIRRIRIAPHALNAAGDYVPIEETPVTTEKIGDRRSRSTTYFKLLESALRDYAEVILSDEDLEEAVYILTQYAKSRGYNIIGTSHQVLAHILSQAEAEDANNG